MCVIIDFKPGQMLDFDKLKTACHNNWHSFGVVTLVDGKLDIKREVPESGEVDPERVQKILREDIQYRRFLHLRHTTAGATNLENCQPFEVFYKGGKNHRHIAFMHNGTLYDYKSKMITDDRTIIDDPNGPSDTANFVETVLSPYISGTDFGNGKGDITSPLIRRLITKFWPTTGNRGLVIANDQDPLFLGEWKKILDEDEQDLVVSNTDYFDKVERGPEFARREAEKKRQEDKNRPFRPEVTTNIPFVKLKDLIPTGRTNSEYELSDSFKHVLNDYDLYDRDRAVNVGYATKDEVRELIKREEDAVYVVEYIFSDYLSLYEEFMEKGAELDTLRQEVEDLKRKHDGATKKIASLIAESKKD